MTVVFVKALVQIRFIPVDLNVTNRLQSLPVLHLEEKTDDQTKNTVISFQGGTSVYLMVHQCPCVV